MRWGYPLAGFLPLLGGCLVDWGIYYDRLADLTDDDGDGVHEVDGDCDDADRTVYPGADEHCDGRDEDCDDQIDEEPVDTESWFVDADSDGYGDDDQESSGCDVPPGGVQQGGDCDDSAVKASPAGTEVCNSIDDDCDGQTDEEALDAPVWYPDQDGDGYGSDGDSVRACIQPEGYASNSEDCLDDDVLISPAATEVCNDGLDNDCDAATVGCGWAPLIDLTRQMQIVGGYDESVAEGAAITDLNGDGANELVLGGYYAINPSSGERDGAVLIFDTPLTSADQFTTDSDRQIWGEGDVFGFAVDTADIDGDGYVDLLVGAPTWAEGSVEDIGRVVVMYGPITNDLEVERHADWLLTGTKEDEEMGDRLVAVGDVSGDNIPDFLGGSWLGLYEGRKAGFLHLFTTAKNGTHAAEQVAQATIGNQTSHGGMRDGVGLDIDGDGQRELLVSASAGNYGDGEVYLFFQDTLHDVLDYTSADETWVGETDALAGQDLDSGDLDGDGREDLLILADGIQDGAAYGVLGSTNVRGGYLGDAPLTFRNDSDTGWLIAMRVGDLNGDGQVDVVFGEGTQAPNDLFVHYGPFGDTSTIYTSDADVRLTTGEDDDELSTILIGDVTDDGVNDLVVGSPIGKDYAGIVYILPGITF